MSAACNMSMFATPDQALQLLSNNERIVRLTLNDPAKTSFYVHPVFLKAWSSVLRSLLDSVEAEVHHSETYCTIPLTDTSTTAWEAVLSLMHPSPVPFKITWNVALPMLFLANKYDMPCVTGHVVAFLEQPAGTLDKTMAQRPSHSNASHYSAYNPYGPSCSTGHYGDPKQSELQAKLSQIDAKDLFSCLTVFSTCGLEQQVQECITYAVEHKAQKLIALPLSMKLLQGLRSEHADQLLSGLAGVK